MENKKELGKTLYTEAIKKIKYLEGVKRGMIDAPIKELKTDSDNREAMSVFNTQALMSRKLEEAYHQKTVAEGMIRDHYAAQIKELDPKELEYMRELNEMSEKILNDQLEGKKFEEEFMKGVANITKKYFDKGLQK